MGLTLTNCNIADNNKDVLKKIKKNIKCGKLIADMGYMGRRQYFLDKNIEIIHKVRKNMKPINLSKLDQALLKKRSLIETVNGILKNVFNLEHTRS